MLYCLGVTVLLSYCGIYTRTVCTIGVKKLFTLLIFNNFSEDYYMALKHSYNIAEMCTILLA